MAKRILHAERVIYTPQTEANWRIPSEKGDYFLFENLAPAGTQEELAKVSGVQSLPVYIDVLGAMYNSRNSGSAIQKARLFVRNAFRTQFPSTLTRIAYMPEGSRDLIVHGYSTQKQRETPANFVGLDGEIQDVLDTKTCLALTGRKPEEVKEIIDWINGTNYAGIWRFNSKPNQRTERVVRFNANSDWSSLGCDGGFPDVRYPALRVSRKNF